MKYISIVIAYLLPNIAFAQYFSGLDVMYGKPNVPDIPPEVKVTSQTKQAALLRLYSGYQLTNGLGLEVGMMIRTPFHQSALYLPLPDTGYKITVNTYNADITLSYQLPEAISSHIRLLTGMVWTKNHYQIEKYVLGEDEAFSVNETKWRPRFGIEYMSPITKNVFWKTTFSKYGDDKILSIGIARYFN